MNDRARDMSFGATLLATGQTRFRLWAPDSEAVQVVVEDGPSIAMARQAEGWFEVTASVGAGTRYRFQVSADLRVPDPAARAQDHDVHGPSVVVDHAAYVWQHPGWVGRPWHEAVIYELHVGTLGGFAGVAAQLERLAELGVTIVELMPIADFPGPRNWGYDGVLPYAPDTAYGSPDALKALVDTAHGLGLMVMLDVVYNHFGPDGNYLGGYASGFYRHDRKTPWGDALDFRRPQVRRFFIENAVSWILDYRIDGLRFDAVHAIDDADFLQEMAAEIRAAAGPDRHVHLVLENEENDAALLRQHAGGPGFDAQWADDLHHCVHVMLTGEHEAYYEDFAKAPAELLARCLQDGFAFQGEVSRHTGGRRGTPSRHLPATSFVICLQNHDQIGNRAFGERIGALAHPDALRAATVLLLMTPQIPLLFMGQEWAAPVPFLYFSSHHDELAEAVRQGRRQEFARFAAFADPEKRARIPDPNHPDSFAASIPDPARISQEEHGAWFDFHRSLLALRRHEITPYMAGATALAAEAIGPAAVRASWRLHGGSKLTVLANLGPEPVACAVAAGRSVFATRSRSAGDALAGYGAEVTIADGAHD